MFAPSSSTVAIRFLGTFLKCSVTFIQDTGLVDAAGGLELKGTLGRGYRFSYHTKLALFVPTLGESGEIRQANSVE
jgi:hypothetical protein